jgi:hypothetical protein
MASLGPTSTREPVDELAAKRVWLEAIDHLTKTTARADTLEDIYGAALDAVAAAFGASRSRKPAPGVEPVWSAGCDRARHWGPTRGTTPATSSRLSAGE